MRIGIAFDLKADVPAAPGQPDDWQEEFDSPEVIAGLSAALRAHGHETVELGDGRSFVEKLLADPPDLVFNIAEGQGIARSREARVPAVCEMLGIPYTGSDPLTLGAALDKDIARRIVASAGVAIPQGTLVPGDRDLATLPFPVIIKPAWEGSSKGIRGKCVVTNSDDLIVEIAERRRAYRQPLLVEEFIRGEELTVGIVGNENAAVVGIMHITPQKPVDYFIYGLEVKRDWRENLAYECPAQIGDAATAAVEHAALTAYKSLGCRDFGRIDFRLRDGVPVFLEANPLAGLHPETGDIVMMSKFVGLSYHDLIGRILNGARERYGL